MVVLPVGGGVGMLPVQHWYAPWLLIAVLWLAVGIFLAAYGDPPDPPDAQ